MRFGVRNFFFKENMGHVRDYRYRGCEIYALAQIPSGAEVPHRTFYDNANALSACTLPGSSHCPHVAVEHLKCG